MTRAALLCALLLLCALMLASVGSAAPDGGGGGTPMPAYPMIVGNVEFVYGIGGDVETITITYANGTIALFTRAVLVTPFPDATYTPEPAPTIEDWPPVTATPTPPDCRGIVTSTQGVNVRAATNTNSLIVAVWGAGKLFEARVQIGEWWQVEGGYVWAGAVSVTCP